MEKKIVVATAILNSKKEVLLLQRAGNKSWGGRWNFPGGKYEPSDKNLSNGAIREAKEESGLQINSLELLGKVSFDNFDMFFYFSDDYSGEVEINDESQDFKWVDIFDLENYKFPMGKLNKKLINSLMNIVGEKNE